MALLRGLAVAERLVPNSIRSRPFHFLRQKDLAVFRAIPELGKLGGPSDYFTQHGSEGVPNFGKAFGDDKMTSKQTSLPGLTPTLKNGPSIPPIKSKCSSRPRADKRVRICANRSGRMIVKPIRVPIVIDIKNTREEPMKRYVVPPPMVNLTLSQRFFALSKDVARLAFSKVRAKSLDHIRKIEPPRLDARRVKKIAIISTPLVTTLVGYLYGKCGGN
ncbi:hypothetical protein M8J75_003228 [Diaphorina citri]|nr:hypothetical protein M8J75_003228 [Diaphorina citri]